MNLISNRFQKSFLATMYIVWFVHLLIIWLYRYVPSVDYPDWLLQANILAHYGEASNDFKQWYELVIAPVPNGGFVLPTALLARLFPIEIAGKIILSLYIIGFPLSVRSYCRALGNDSPWWSISIVLLFNISFFNGNMSFLMGMCLLFFMMSFTERRREHTSVRVYLTVSALTLLLFLSHAVCAAIYMLYIVILLSGNRVSYANKKILLLSVVEILLLGLIYYITRPDEKMITAFNWSLDIRYRVGLLRIPFFTGWVYPPFQSSSFTAGSRILFILFGLSISVAAFRSLVRTFSSSAVSQLTLVVLLITFLGPKHMLGIAELSHRLALIAFVLLLGFVNRSKKTSRLLLLTLSLIAVDITIIHWNDYQSSSALIGKRKDFLSSVIPPGQPIVTFDDDLGESKARTIPIVPKGVSFTFQSDYLILSSGYNPFSFYTGYLVPRDTFIFYFYHLTKDGKWEDQTLMMHGSNIPSPINYVILDAGSDWGTDMAQTLQDNFALLAETELTHGVHTLVLKRVQ